MLEMIEDRKGSAVLEERQDLLSNLIRASMEKTDPRQKDFDSEFTHRDLLGNIFLFLLAGKLFRFLCSRLYFSIKLCWRL
jgi:cytochrome P450